MGLTGRIKRLKTKLKHRFEYWVHTVYLPWFKRNKDLWIFRYLERARWFKWYGKRVVHVRPKSPEKLSFTEAEVKAAIVAKDYQKALDIVNQLPHNSKTIALKQVIQAKLG